MMWMDEDLEKHSLANVYRLTKVVIAWKNTDDLPNSPNFLSAKLSCYMVF